MRFTTRTTLTATILTAALAMATAQAQTPEEHAAHHPGSQGTTEVQPATPGSQTAPMMPQAGPAGNMMDLMKMMGSAGSQGGQPGMMGNGMGGMMRMMQTMMAQGGMGGGMGLLSAEHIEGRIAYLRTELKITDAQLAQWTTFADTLRSNAKALQQAHTQAKPGNGASSAPDQLDRQATLATAQAEALKTLAGAERSLYAALTDEQKQLADELLTGCMPEMRGSRT